MKTIINLSTAILCALLLFQCQEGGKMEVETRKPNIIYIMADDLGYGDLGCYGQEKFATPNIDRLAEGGMRFTQHYAGSTVCAPSRSVLMTGLHTGHTHVRGNRGVNDGQFPLPDSAVTVPKLLKEAGYVTGAFGKWGLGYPGSTGDPLNQGIDEFFGYNSQTFAHNYYPWELWHNEEKIYLEENEGEKQGLYAPDLIHEKTLAFLENHKDTSFFLFMPSIIPHAEMFAPEAYMDMFVEKSSPEQPYTLTSKFEPETSYEGVDDPGHPRFKKGGYGSQAHPRAAFAAMVKLLDDHVGEILAKVQELGLEDNTLIIFTSDNGPHREGGADPDFFNSNGPFQGYKRDLYEGGIRMPMIAYWPGKVKANSQTGHISAFWDVMPTLCGLAGLEHPAYIDGISFLPTLFGAEGQETHPYLYWEFHEQGRKQAVRMGDWKGIRVGLAENPEAPIALYNLSEDIGEENNIAEKHPEIVEEIKQIMQEARFEDTEWPFFEERGGGVGK